MHRDPVPFSIWISYTGEMNTQEKQELIATMKAQHATIMADLAELHRQASLPICDPDSIRAGVERLTRDLTTHLQLEDVTFYPAYMDLKHRKGESTERLEQYIKEMQIISQSVNVFIEHVLESGACGDATFMPQLERITQMITVRIETEEEGPYEKFLSE